jgi:hypothetical protein
MKGISVIRLNASSLPKYGIVTQNGFKSDANIVFFTDLYGFLTENDTDVVLNLKI